MFARSLKDPEHELSTTNLTILVFTKPFKDLEFEEEEIKVEMVPNSITNIPVLIKNIGNQIDDTINFNVNHIPDNWEVMIDTSDIPKEGLSRDTTAIIELILKTPTHVVESLYKLWLTAETDGHVKDELTINVYVSTIRAIDFKCKNNEKIGNISERISFIITLENLGNNRDTILLDSFYITKSMEDGDWNVSLSKDIISLYPYESRDVIVSIFIPMTALADTDYISPIQNGYKFLIRGTSQNNTNIFADQELEVLVYPFYDFSLNKEKDVKYLLIGTTESDFYTFTITNEGNHKDIFTINYESEHQWMYIARSQLSLLPGITDRILVELKPSENLKIGTYEFFITCTSQHFEQEPELVCELVLTVEIIKCDLAVTELRIGNTKVDDFKGNLKQGNTVLLRAKLENLGDIDYYNKSIQKFLRYDKEIELIVEFTEGSNYIGEVIVYYLPTLDNSDEKSIWVGVPWKVGATRLYELLVVIDPEEQIPDSNRTNNKQRANILVNEQGSKVDSDEDPFNKITYQINIIILFFIILIMGIYLIVHSSKIKQRRLHCGLGYTKEGEYKPYGMLEIKDSFKNGAANTEINLDIELNDVLGDMVEPEFGVLDLQNEELEQSRKKDKFISDIEILMALKPIRKTKPIRRSKPLRTTKKYNYKFYQLKGGYMIGYLPLKNNI
jgi:uncharacterized membrane protein